MRRDDATGLNKQMYPAFRWTKNIAFFVVECRSIYLDERLIGCEIRDVTQEIVRVGTSGHQPHSNDGTAKAP